MDTNQLRPVALGLAPSFGYGDRLGNATAGHLDAHRQAAGPIKGIFAQQSIREMRRTARTAEQVMQSAASALASARFQDDWGADADHLKTPEDVAYTADAGFVFYTIDPSDHVDQQADGYQPADVVQRSDSIQVARQWIETYAGRSESVAPGVTIEFDELAVRRAAVKYGAAADHAKTLADCIQRETSARRLPCEIELSVDETEQPTSLAEHYIIADQCLSAGMPLVSLAPRFIGDFEKGVDFKGDLADLENSLAAHAAIARHLGPYKLSLHSGSDKLSMYGMLARATEGLFHVKTAGTSYLEALRVVALCDPSLFREVINFARSRYETDRATYHVSATLPAALDPNETPADRELLRCYLECWEDVPPSRGFTELGRQVLHCTFGSVLTDERLGGAVRQVLDENESVHREVLAEHFRRHLEALNAG